MNILVLGGGTFGTAIANELSVNTENNVVLFSRNQQKVDEINTDHTNKSCFPNKHLTKFLSASSDKNEIKQADVIFIALPSSVIIENLGALQSYFKQDVLLVNLSKGLLENLCHAIKIALDLKINKKIIEKTIPKISFEGRFQFLNRGKIKNKIHKNEMIMLDGAHAEADAKNLASYLKTIKLPKYGIWAMMKSKEPDLFIKQFKKIFKKLIVIPIENEQASMSEKKLYQIASKNKFNTEKANNLNEALKKISPKEKKLIVCFGSLYNIGNILNKN